MARISLIPIENYSILDREHDREHDCEHGIVVRTFLDGLGLGMCPAVRYFLWSILALPTLISPLRGHR